MCNYLPRSVSQQCVQFVNTYSDMIIDLVTHDVTPDQVMSIYGVLSDGTVLI
jgi:hypothetical protein